VSEVLIGVVIGGLIAWIAPLLTLRYGERRWKFEARINHLKSERQRMEALYEKNLPLFAEGMATNGYSSNMSSEMMILMPKDIGDLFLAHMADKTKTDEKSRATYLELAAAMKLDLKARDEEIRNLFDDA
jgi:hypothetical protein